MVPNGLKLGSSGFNRIAFGAKPPASVHTSGKPKGVGARPPCQNWRKYLKSANTVKYLSQRSRSTDPYRYSRSVDATSGVRSAKLNNARSDGAPAPNRLVYCELS